MTPVTGLGKFLGGIVALFGIAMFAVPTGILGSAFGEAFRKGDESSVLECLFLCRSIVLSATGRMGEKNTYTSGL